MPRPTQITASPELPWYLTALLVSQPLHFGDYGGMPMQIIWALLDIATIIVLGSGLYLWLKRGNAVPAAARPDEAGHRARRARRCRSPPLRPRRAREQARKRTIPVISGACGAGRSCWACSPASAWCRRCSATAAFGDALAWVALGIPVRRGRLVRLAPAAAASVGRSRFGRHRVLPVMAQRGAAPAESPP